MTITHPPARVRDQFQTSTPSSIRLIHQAAALLLKTRSPQPPVPGAVDRNPSMAAATDHDPTAHLVHLRFQARLAEHAGLSQEKP